MATPTPATLTAAINQAVASTTSPYQSWKDWAVYTFNGVTSPGIIAKDGIRGFERVTEWDAKEGKGQQGGNITRTKIPLARGAITSMLWGTAQWYAWDAFVPLLLKYSTTNGYVDAATLSHPELLLLNISAVVVHKVHPRRHVGGLLFLATVEFIEWTPQPTATIVNTPLKADTASQISVPGDLDPDVRDAQAAFAQSQAEHAAAVGAP